MSLRYGFPAVVALAAFLSGGCVRAPVRAPVVDPIESALAEAARAVEQAWAQQNAIAAAVAPARAPTAPALPSAFGERVDMDWQGELAPAVQALTTQVGYVFREIGARPIPPIMVAVVGRNETVGNLLRAAGLQGGTRADVVVGDRDITVVYRDKALVDGR